jgi:hypothetical protein
MDIQIIIVGIIIAAAVIYVARSIYKSAKGHSCESGSCGCDSGPLKKKAKV